MRIVCGVSPWVEDCGDEEQMKIKPQSKPFVSKTSNGAEAQDPNYPGNPLAWLLDSQPAAVAALRVPVRVRFGVRVAAAETRARLYAVPPLAISHTFRHPLLLSTIPTSTMSYDIEPGGRRIPTLVQCCQRGEDVPRNTDRPIT